MIVDYFVSSEDVLLTADIVDDNDNVITSAAERGLMFCFGFIFIYLFFYFFTILSDQLSAGPILAKFAGLIELWL